MQTEKYQGCSVILYVLYVTITTSGKHSHVVKKESQTIKWLEN